MGLLCLYFFIVSSLQADAQTNTARNISTGSNSNGFYEYLPAGYATSSQTYPLLVFIQGQGEHAMADPICRGYWTTAPHIS